jgi:hypothetical protein
MEEASILAFNVFVASLPNGHFILKEVAQNDRVSLSI